MWLLIGRKATVKRRTTAFTTDCSCCTPTVSERRGSSFIDNDVWVGRTPAMSRGQRLTTAIFPLRLVARVHADDTESRTIYTHLFATLMIGDVSAFWKSLPPIVPEQKIWKKYRLSWASHLLLIVFLNKRCRKIPFVRPLTRSLTHARTFYTYSKQRLMNINIEHEHNH